MLYRSDSPSALSHDSGTEKDTIDNAESSPETNKDPEPQGNVMAIDESCRSETSPVNEAAIQAADRPASMVRSVVPPTSHGSNPLL